MFHLASCCRSTDRASVANRGASAVGSKPLGSSPDCTAFRSNLIVVGLLQDLAMRMIAATRRSADIPDRAHGDSIIARIGGAKNPIRDRLGAETGRVPDCQFGKRRRWPIERPHPDRHAGVVSWPQGGRPCSHGEREYRRPGLCQAAARWPTPPAWTADQPPVSRGSSRSTKIHPRTCRR